MLLTLAFVSFAALVVAWGWLPASPALEADVTEVPIAAEPEAARF